MSRYFVNINTGFVDNIVVVEYTASNDWYVIFATGERKSYYTHYGHLCSWNENDIIQWTMNNTWRELKTNPVDTFHRQLTEINKVTKEIFSSRNFN